MALLAEIDDHRLVIKRHAWREGNWNQVFHEASEMGGDIDRLRGCFMDLHQKWIAETKDEHE